MQLSKRKKIILEILSTILAIILGVGAGFLIKDCSAGCSRRDLLHAELTFTVTDKNGKSITLSNLPKKPVVINFWAIWCGPCLAELPDFQEAYEEYSEEVTFLFINVLHWRNNTVTQVENFLSSNGYTFPTYYDTHGNASDECNVNSIPLTIFMGKDGKVKQTHSGTINKSKLISGIKNLL